ncbi:MAG TPA: hypothetical protein VGG18_02505 [Granulicella sp.]
MQRYESQIDQPGQLARVAVGLGAVLTLCWLAGCGSGVGPATQTATTTPSPSLQTYFAPYVTGVTGGETPLTYTLDDVGGAFSQTTYQPLTQPGPQVLSAGTLAVGQRGLRSLGITATYAYDNGASPPAYEVTPYPKPGLPGSFAIELAGQAGGLVQMVGQAVQPLVAATQCPSFSTAQPYQFVTIPVQGWNPSTDTAYGSVGIVSSGSAVTFQNIYQDTLTGASTQLASVTGVCGPTFFGSITNVPGQLVITDPGIGTLLPAQAQIGIGSSGLLVEDNGAGQNISPSYENVLGAGTGAVGLLKPTSALDTSAVVGAQYLGFIYAAGAAATKTTSAGTFSSNLSSFGVLTSASSVCASFAGGPSSGTSIYGGDFPSGNPANSSNCDFAIDLGQQDTSNNGLYPQAKVWLGPSYPGYSPSIKYPFSAVAVAGQLGGKYAIFLIGFDSIQPWAVYLLQSN